MESSYHNCTTFNSSQTNRKNPLPFAVNLNVNTTIANHHSDAGNGDSSFSTWKQVRLEQGDSFCRQPEEEQNWLVESRPILYMKDCVI